MDENNEEKNAEGIISITVYYFMTYFIFEKMLCGAFIFVKY